MVSQWPTQNSGLREFVQHAINLCQPKHVHFATAAKVKTVDFLDLLVEQGTLRRLNPQLRPNSFLAWSDTKDVARVEDRTFVCSLSREAAGPNNNWREPPKCASK